MASEILYKFKSSNEYASLRFDGSFISVGEVKRVVAEKSGISMDQACELLLTNAQSNIEYKDDSALIPKNTSVVVRRVPAMRKMPIGTSSATTSQHQHQQPTHSLSAAYQKQLQSGASDLGSGDQHGDAEAQPKAGDEDVVAGEGEALESVLQSVNEDWNRQRIATGAPMGRGRGGRSNSDPKAFAPPPPGYVCKRCGKTGHRVQHCPTISKSENDAKPKQPPHGIPSTRIQPSSYGGLLLPTGESGTLQPEELSLETFEQELGFLREEDETGNEEKNEPESSSDARAIEGTSEGGEKLRLTEGANEENAGGLSVKEEPAEQQYESASASESKEPKTGTVSQADYRQQQQQPLASAQNRPYVPSRLPPQPHHGNMQPPPVHRHAPPMGPQVPPGMVPPQAHMGRAGFGWGFPPMGGGMPGWHQTAGHMGMHPAMGMWGRGHAPPPPPPPPQQMTYNQPQGQHQHPSSSGPGALPGLGGEAQEKEENAKETLEEEGHAQRRKGESNNEDKTENHEDDHGRACADDDDDDDDERDVDKHRRESSSTSRYDEDSERNEEKEREKKGSDHHRRQRGEDRGKAHGSRRRRSRNKGRSESKRHEPADSSKRKKEESHRGTGRSRRRRDRSASRQRLSSPDKKRRRSRSREREARRR